MLDHVSVAVSDYDAARAFYSAALAPLGYRLAMEPMPRVGGFSADVRAGQGAFPLWIYQTEKPTLGHLAITAPDRATVDAFHAAALAAGATDNGGPGPRPLYHEHYYGAYVHTPDGLNLEAVCHLPEGGTGQA